jgi:hypothetical protein
MIIEILKLLSEEPKKFKRLLINVLKGVFTIGLAYKLTLSDVNIVLSEIKGDYEDWFVSSAIFLFCLLILWFFIWEVIPFILDLLIPLVVIIIFRLFLFMLAAIFVCWDSGISISKALFKWNKSLIVKPSLKGFGDTFNQNIIVEALEESSSSKKMLRKLATARIVIYVLDNLENLELAKERTVEYIMLFVASVYLVTKYAIIEIPEDYQIWFNTLGIIAFVLLILTITFLNFIISSISDINKEIVYTQALKISTMGFIIEVLESISFIKEFKFQPITIRKKGINVKHVGNNDFLIEGFRIGYVSQSQFDELLKELTDRPPQKDGRLVIIFSDALPELYLRNLITKNNMHFVYFESEDDITNAILQMRPLFYKEKVAPLILPLY